MKLTKKFLSILLCTIMVLGSVAVGGEGFTEIFEAFTVKVSAAKVTSYKIGDIIEFGWYPQSKETDSSIISSLNATDGEWISYNYYSGTGSEGDGQMKPSDYMRYKDVMFGSTKYRGVIFDNYRPCYTGLKNTGKTKQDDNGYTTGNIYWFKYEPIKWRVLDPAAGMVISETILDSQAFNNYRLIDTYESYGNFVKTYYTNNYTESSIRKWLNDDFYNTAFSPAQQIVIQKTTLDNSACSTTNSKFNSESTSDKIYLLSWNDVLNRNYGFSSSESAHDITRRAKGSDYAKCQGLDVLSGDSYDENSIWRLRSPGGSSSTACYVYYDGYVGDYDYGSTYSTDRGIRPALNFNLNSDLIQSDVKDTGTNSGNIAETRKSVIAKLEKEKSSFESDEAKEIIEEVIIKINELDDSDEIYKIMYKALDDASKAEKSLGNAKIAAKSELSAIKKNAKSDEAKFAIDEGILNVDKATNLDSVAEAKIKAIANADDADKAYELRIKLDSIILNIADEKSINYRSKVIIKATATGADGYYLLLNVNGKEVKGSDAEVSYTIDELKSDVTYSVKVVDSNGNVQKDSNGNELSKDSKITVNAGFFKKLVAFFKGLFKALPKVEVKP